MKNFVKSIMNRQLLLIYLLFSALSAVDVNSTIFKHGSFYINKISDISNNWKVDLQTDNEGDEESRVEIRRDEMKVRRSAVCRDMDNKLLWDVIFDRQGRVSSWRIYAADGQTLDETVFDSYGRLLSRKISAENGILDETYIYSEESGFIAALNRTLNSRALNSVKYFTSVQGIVRSEAYSAENVKIFSEIYKRQNVKVKLGGKIRTVSILEKTRLTADAKVTSRVSEYFLEGNLVMVKNEISSVRTYVIEKALQKSAHLMDPDQSKHWSSSVKLFAQRKKIPPSAPVLDDSKNYLRYLISQREYINGSFSDEISVFTEDGVQLEQYKIKRSSGKVTEIKKRQMQPLSAGTTIKVDADGRILSKTLKNSSEKKLGSWEWKYDAKNFIISETFHDSEGKTGRRTDSFFTKALPDAEGVMELINNWGCEGWNFAGRRLYSFTAASIREENSIQKGETVDKDSDEITESLRRIRKLGLVKILFYGPTQNIEGYARIKVIPGKTGDSFEFKFFERPPEDAFEPVLDGEMQKALSAGNKLAGTYEEFVTKAEDKLNPDLGLGHESMRERVLVKTGREGWILSCVREEYDSITGSRKRVYSAGDNKITAAEDKTLPQISNDEWIKDASDFPANRPENLESEEEFLRRLEKGLL